MSAEVTAGDVQPLAGQSLSLETVVDVRGLSVAYHVGSARHEVVSDVSFPLRRCETTALVGESGSGKTTVARAMMGLVRPPTGTVDGVVEFEGENLLGVSPRRASSIYGRNVSMIFQEPMRSLNPAYSVGDQIAEVVRRHTDASRKDAWRRAVEAMEQVRIPRAAERARSYPFQFSGGMCQRVMIAMAIVCKPSVLIADEPTTALDVTVQAQVLDLLKDLQAELGLAILFITHDLGVVADIADKTMVMYAGQVAEHGATAPVFSSPHHPYTEGLLRSIPRVRAEGEPLGYIPGRVPQPNAWPHGCRFMDRCSYAVEACGEPVSLRSMPGRRVRCLRAEELTLEGLDG